jgi:hypothetical protein
MNTINNIKGAGWYHSRLVMNILNDNYRKSDKIRMALYNHTLGNARRLQERVVDRLTVAQDAIYSLEGTVENEIEEYEYNQ